MAGSLLSDQTPTSSNLLRPGIATWDAGGATILPGFIDTNNHANGTVLLYEVLVGNPFEVEFVTVDSIVQKLRAADNLADYVVLNENPYSIPDDRIKNIKIMRTVVGGKTVYEA